MQNNVRPLALFVGLCCLSATGLAQSPNSIRDLARLKDFRALRASSNHADWGSNDDSKRPIPAETVVIADLAGPGQVNHIWLTVAASDYGWPRLLRLRVYYDGSSSPSVDAPVGDFFAVGHGTERTVESLLVRNSSGGRSRNSYWPMPFRKACKITITNEGTRRVSNLYYHVDWQRMKALPDKTGYFHALYRQGLPAALGKRYEVLSVTGRGHYVGTVFSVIQNQPGWFGEGDDFFYVDGEDYPSIEGTGSEDYFNDAWGLRVDTGPYAGVSIAEGTDLGSRMSAYRWHLLDPIPFERSLRFEIEHAGWTFHADGSVRSAFEEREDLLSSVAFWYQEGIAEGLPAPPYGAARLPHGNARQIEAETLIASVKAQGGEVGIQKEVFWGRDLLLFQAESPGATLDLPLHVEEDGYYEVVAQIAHAPDYGIYQALLDGGPLFDDSKPGDEPGTDSGHHMALYNVETYVAVDHLLGWRRLKKGRHTLRFVCSGKQAESANFSLGLDTLVLAKVASESPMGGERAAVLRRIGERGTRGEAQAMTVRAGMTDKDPFVRQAAAWALTQMGPEAGSSLDTLEQALADPDPIVRGLSLIAITHVGSDAFALLAQVIARLKDSDENVRLKAGEAIGSMGPGAAPAVSALIEAARAEGEQTHVLRSIADALGEIGPAARSALPALQELGKMPRVAWAARAAIAAIENVKSEQP